MNSVNIQFHALREEIFDLVKDWSNKFNFYSVKGKLFPKFIAEEILNSDLLIESDLKTEEIDFIYLGLSKPKLETISNYDFLDKNPNYLSIHFGKISAEGLRESSVSGKTNTTEELKIWNKIVREIRNKTSTGL